MKTRRSPAAAPLSTTGQLAFELGPDPPPQRPPQDKPPLPQRVVYTVRELIGEVRQHVEGAYARSVSVEGEISNCRSAASGHLYFTLKDGDAQLPVVLFRRQVQLLPFRPKDGLAVEAQGTLTVYETRGQLQLIAETLRPRGAGALQLAFEQLRDRLRREGLFDRPKQPLPPFPQCIGVITSPHGAAIRDIIQVVRRRHARLNLLVYPAPMQGAGCAAGVAAGIRWFNRQAAGRAGGEGLCVDLIVLARGGGSLEDLAGFNDEALARTIAASRLPVVSAIGHEIDHTIADFVADLRAPTPSAAAELVTTAQHRIEERVRALEARVERAGRYHLLRAAQRLDRLSASHVLARLRDAVSLRHRRLDDLQAQIGHAAERRLRLSAVRVSAVEERLRRQDPGLRLTLAQRRLDGAEAHLARLATELTARRRERLDRVAGRLHALSPLAVLNRGYAIVYLDDAAGGPGQVLRDSHAAAPHQLIRARLATGSLRARVTEALP